MNTMSSAAAGTSEIPKIGDYVPGKGTLIWSDEFEGTHIDRSKWNIETGNGSQYGLANWGNGELQDYREENAFLENGMLIIEARQTTGAANQRYTSARLTTGQTRTSSSGSWTPQTFSVKTGTVEARIKISEGAGFWPAFWLLGSNSYGAIQGTSPLIEQQGWPLCGEIDILEFFGGKEDVLIHSIHYGAGYSGSNGWRHTSRYAGIQSDNGQVVAGYSEIQLRSRNVINMADDFHIYGVRWDERGIQFMLNGVDTHFIPYTVDTREGSIEWMKNFYSDAGFSIIINLAIGGNMGNGRPDPSLFNGSNNRLMVDWVRIFDSCTIGGNY